MCISNIMTRNDLFTLPCGNKFYVTNDDGDTLEAFKITQMDTADHRILIADFPELGEDGESVVIHDDHIDIDGSFLDMPQVLRDFGDDLRLCMEGNHA